MDFTSTNGNKGLGSYFLDTLYSDIDSLAYYGGIYCIVFGYYRLMSKRFPFAVYYKISGGHHVFRKEGVLEMVNLQREGNKAKPYQVWQARNIIL